MATTKELAALLGLEVEVTLVGKQINVPGTLMRGGAWQTITVHETANKAPGADARMHRRFVANGGGENFVSFTYAVDSKRAVQILPENWVNWAQGTIEGNTTSLSIEVCVNSDGDWAATKDNLYKLLACLLQHRNKGTDVLRQHNVWYGKNCPATIRGEGSWTVLIPSVSNYVILLERLLDKAKEREFPTGHKVRGPFLQYFEAHGDVPEFGYPITAEREEQIGPWLGVVQWFERARMELHDGQVWLGLVGSEALAAREG